ncbi:sensor histidine kinase [Nocardioides ferulae]|uniref:sensor histidine kinase n=1 Tax=Nocardioides ferulae TaxID=2340821 RepID=UPI000EAE1997|nr:sensor histidine kinase [Nocardioides ferulae]
MRPSPLSVVRLAGAARAFAVLVLLVPVFWSDDSTAMGALGAVAALWLLCQVFDRRADRLLRPLGVLEPALVGVLAGYALQSSYAMLGALAVPPFTAGLRGGLRGVALAMASLLGGFVGTGLLLFGRFSDEQVSELATWSFTGLGLGLIASFVHSALRRTDDPLGPYLYAQDLIRQLIGLTGGLSSGLDPKTLGGAILSAVLDDLPAATVALHVPRGDGLTPLVTKSVDSDIQPAPADGVAARAWAEGRPVEVGAEFAFPLLSEGKPTAVVAGRLSDQLDLGRLGLPERSHRLMRRLESSAVHLDTALMFDAFRDAATAEERRRLSREMHDGIAQDIASLGYLIDAIAAREESSEQRERIDLLRGQVTQIVAEVRRSVINLRTSIGENESLGTAIGSIARNLSQVSGTPIHVTLDERTTRLRPEVEAELFRITQEAINNAVRHAGASRIDVHCQVQPPAARITVADDGRGLQAGRDDSQGLEIMRERARLIGAELSIGASDRGGVAVSVRLGEPPAADPSRDGTMAGGRATDDPHKVSA